LYYLFYPFFNVAFYILLLLFFPPKQPYFLELSLFYKFNWIDLQINDKKGFYRETS